MAKTDFFERKKPVLPRKEFTAEDLPAFGEMILEKIDTPRRMHLDELFKAKYEQWGPDGPFPFLVGDRPIQITDVYARSAAALVVMQVQSQKYNWEDFIAASYTDEDEYNLLVIAANDLNQQVTADPKASISPVLLEDSTEDP